MHLVFEKFDKEKMSHYAVYADTYMLKLVDSVYVSVYVSRRQEGYRFVTELLEHPIYTGSIQEIAVIN